MVSKLKRKNGMTLVEVLVTLVVTSIFFTIVGTIVYTYRNVTNVAIEQAQQTSTSSLVFSAFDKMTTKANSDDSYGKVYYHVDKATNDFYFFYEKTGLNEEDEKNGMAISYTTGTHRLKYESFDSSGTYDGYVLDIDTQSIGRVALSVTNHQLLQVSILDGNNGIIAQRSFYFVRSVLYI